ncbi:iron transporter [Geovibrio thiophilus]|uniref:Iron transporter n=1 Tax=Geovibrio thiophilus TaxID=139438 RepID=A0A3R6AYG9_9BACT|nr:iron transporter [Geovibrio thiophilus]QAR33458.1 iron transporter [Geovibrio thiophilus]
MTKNSSGMRYKAEVASRVLLAVFGGYALSAFVTLWITKFMPFEPRYAATAANMLFYLIYTCAVIWSFANIRTITAWLGICIPAALLGGLLLLPWSVQ